ncbi:MAG: hypothetical protein A4E74_00965 [Syntrophus sp. PtaB.Bin075]|nr:MAG: hypothetical protein A4E74_00965 [Syntrophus sp. PtaB.Bin075]
MTEHFPARFAALLCYKNNLGSACGLIYMITYAQSSRLTARPLFFGWLWKIFRGGGIYGSHIMKAALFAVTLLIIILNILDVYTTRLALKQGGYEANPLVRFLMRNHLFIPVKAAVVTAVIMLMAASDQHTALLTGVFCCLIYLAIVGNNFRTLRHLKKRSSHHAVPVVRASQKKTLL